MVADVDEPPEEPKSRPFWSPPKPTGIYRKAPPTAFTRRESLLTRQLHSETEHSDEDRLPHPPRALSTQSTWSNLSTASAAELTSDDGISMPSPAISPPLPPTHIRNALPISEMPLDKKLKIIGQEDVASSQTGSEKSIEATLGRKRCIMFACRGKDEAKPKAPSPPPIPVSEKPAEAEQPKRKCMIKFACPMKSGSERKAAETIQMRRSASPQPMQRMSSGNGNPDSSKVHRGSDSTVTHGSPKAVRKSPNVATTAPIPTAAETPEALPMRRLSNDSIETGTEATRFHEFYSSEDEPEEWVQEVTCHRSRLTVSDTLQKENVLRKACEEVEEEAIEEEGEDDEEAAAEVDEADVLDEDAEEDQEDDQDEDDESDGTDAGFHSDDEHGFAASDSEGEESDYEWWRPGGSTAATSIEHLDRLTIHQKHELEPIASSFGSASSGHVSPHSPKRHLHRSPRNRHRTPAIPISKRTEGPILPDSTDFVCGTLDEDRPLEQAYLNRKKDLEAAKHKARPQDIDPSFPTSDPEMDEEDDEDIEDPEESENENMVHGEMDELDHQSTLRRRPSPALRRKTTAHRSPPPAGRYHSPPPSRVVSKHHSPPPPSKRMARSPPPRKLFGQSPKHARSPPTHNTMTSPPNTRRSSPSRGAAFATAAQGLAERPQLTHTASLPRNGVFLLSRMRNKHQEDNDGSDTIGAARTDIPKRGAIDIVKGLEKKRQRRKEKMWQKMCAKNAAKGEKAYKVKPGKGAERMREVGLELQRYRGKGEHIISV
ncbi:hypothetical protein LTR36_002761 [Oleoguttula mirabilis]|uniref:Extensin domain-containing protein n=1 Tax=Oleoguttula mirabilis TaxID=1507867 RepID=A0AAV9JJD7_9PEZI|nr:hypothetical protein LTR36_002761 [Oleoguttula mirabilis]